MTSKTYGFLRVAAASPRVWLANPVNNAEEIIRMAGDAANDGTSVLVFPELCVTGYSCADLFAQERLLSAAENAVAEILDATKKLPTMLAIGAPVRFEGRLYNCALLLKEGKLLGIVPKTYLPNAAEFYEMRWFQSGDKLAEPVAAGFAGQKALIGIRQLFKLGHATVGVEICQDLWVPLPPCTWAALAGAQVILNLSASNEALCKQDYRSMLVRSTSARLNAAYVYSSCGYGESTQDLVWGGSSLICENGVVLAENERFGRESSVITADVDVERLENVRARNVNFREILASVPTFMKIPAGDPAPTDFEKKLLKSIDPHPFVPSGDAEELSKRCREILDIQTLGLCTRLEHIGCRTAVIGISGGLDSTLALLVTARAFDRLGWERSRIIGITMPGFGTSGRTKGNADILMEKLGITRREISIVPAATQHLKDIDHPLDKTDTTYENAQARERTQILMDVAGQEGGIVVGTGDLSELALGWCTYNGDHMSMYGVNASVPKTLVRTLVAWAAKEHFADASDVLSDIVDTPISPELLPTDEKGAIAQVTEDIVGPYELHDFFLYQVMRWGFDPEKVLFLAKKAFAGTYNDATIKKWLDTFYRRFFSQQFKRSCMPDGPKVGSVSLSPRGDWRMPSDASSELWRQ
ncbi:MAG: NAD(+) synthase [Bacteroidales bacterium]|nr:NAD(+) synthase [Bacteroidales bacterium]